jgi:hypothetical protein
VLKLGLLCYPLGQVRTYSCVQYVRFFFFLLLEANQPNRLVGVRYVRERAYGDENVQVNTDVPCRSLSWRATYVWRCAGARECETATRSTVLVSCATRLRASGARGHRTPAVLGGTRVVWWARLPDGLVRSMRHRAVLAGCMGLLWAFFLPPSSIVAALLSCKSCCLRACLAIQPGPRQ